MKQIWPNYSYSPATNVLTLTGLNIDRDQLLLVTAADRGRIMYNFADSSVTASAFTSGANTALTLVATTAGLTTTAALVIYYDDQLASTTVTVSSLPAISGTVTANVGQILVKNNITGSITSGYLPFGDSSWSGQSGAVMVMGGADDGAVPVHLTSIAGLALDGGTIGSLPISGTVTIGSALPAGTNQIGSVTASISGTVPISISSVTVGSVPPIQWSNANGGNAPTTVNQNAPLPVQLYTGAVPSSVTIGAIIANSVTIGSLPAISGTVTANTFALQGTAVTTSNFTSTTASTVLANYNATREVLTIFNEGAGNLHVCAGATCTTIAYQVRLSAGDYYEVPNHQTSLTHSAVFATAGTARIVQIS
jgi:hypothetical protein